MDNLEKAKAWINSHYYAVPEGLMLGVKPELADRAEEITEQWHYVLAQMLTDYSTGRPVAEDSASERRPHPKSR